MTNHQSTTIASSKASSRLGLRIEQARWELQLPDGARRLIASGDFNGRENETMVRWLTSDKQLSSRLLRWCNTPLFNLCKPYESLDGAVAVMDGRTLSQLAVLAWARGLFSPDRQIDLYSRERLWAHSMAVASISSLIARTCNLEDPEVAFAAGALHDIGLLASERLDAEAFADVLSEIDELSPSFEVEKDQQGWDHAQLGAAILDHWGMPQAIVQSAANHHHAHRNAVQAKTADAEDIGVHQTVCCVAMANYLCSRAGWSSIGSVAISPPRENVMQFLGIDSGLITVLWQQLSSSLESVSELN